MKIHVNKLKKLLKHSEYTLNLMHKGDKNPHIENDDDDDEDDNSMTMLTSDG